MPTDSRSEQLAQHLTEDILRQRYRVGERLPSERDLATRHDISRGAVREALHHMQNLGIIEIQPGGARVRPVNEATLDIIGPLMSTTTVPDPDLIGQLLDVLNALMSVAVQSMLTRASDSQIDRARALITEIRAPGTDEMQRFNLRLELSRTFMEASGNLILQLISNSLRVQLEPHFERPGPSPDVANAVYSQLLDQLDASLAARDEVRVNEAMSALHRLNRRAVMTALTERSTPTAATTTQTPLDSSPVDQLHAAGR